MSNFSYIYYDEVSYIESKSADKITVAVSVVNNSAYTCINYVNWETKGYIR